VGNWLVEFENLLKERRVIQIVGVCLDVKAFDSHTEALKSFDDIRR
jgi:hypothetical protein